MLRTDIVRKLIIAILGGILIGESAYLLNLGLRHRGQSVPLQQAVQHIGTTTEPGGSKKEFTSQAPNTPQSVAQQGAELIVGNIEITDPAEIETLRRETVIKASPEYQRLQTLRKLASIDVRYGLLFRELQLEPEKQARLRQLILDKEEGTEDLNHVLNDPAVRAQLEGGATGKTFYQELKAQQAGEIEDDIRTLVGDEGLKRLKEYETWENEYAVVSELQQVLANKYETLTKQQIQSLASALANGPAPKLPDPKVLLAPYGSSKRPISTVYGQKFLLSTGPGAYISDSGFVAANYPVTDALIDSAATFMNFSQLASLREIMDKQRAERAIGKIYFARPPRIHL